jgi:hypothetical protein
MRSPAQAIIWEICAKNRLSLLFAFGLIPFCALLWILAGPGHEIVKMVHVFSNIATFVSIIWVSTYTANHSRGRFSGFPSWMYTLPLRTFALVLYPMLLGFFLTFVAVVAWELTTSRYWGAPFEWKHLGWHVLLFVGALFSVQALVWSLHRFRWIRVVALVAVIYGFLYVGLVAHTFNFFGGAALWFAGVSLTIPLAVAGAIAGVERDRHGGWQGWTGKMVEYLLDLIPRRRNRFASAAGAQFWIEWRRKGVFLVVVFGFSMALSMCLFPLGAALYLRPVETMFHFSYPFLLMIVFGGILGSAIAKSDAWSPELGIHSTVATKPMSTSALVFAKMKAAAVVTFLGWVLFAVLLVPVIALHGRFFWWSDAAPNFWSDFPTNYPRFRQWISNPVVILALVAVTWHTVVQTMAVALTGNKRRIVMRAWQGMIVLAVVIGTALWLYKDRSKADVVFRFLPWFTMMMMGLKTWGTVHAFAAAKATVSSRDFLILVGLWLFIVSLVISAGILAHIAHGLPTALLWLLVLWQFFPSGEIPQCVVALQSNRHR